MTPISTILTSFLDKLGDKLQHAIQPQSMNGQAQPEPARKRKPLPLEQSDRMRRLKVHRPDLHQAVLDGKLKQTHAYRQMKEEGQQKPPPNRYADLCEAWNDATLEERERFLSYAGVPAKAPEGFPQPVQTL